MIILGLVLALVGWLMHLGLLVTVGLIVAAVGLVLALVGSTGHPVGGRSHWY